MTDAEIAALRARVEALEAFVQDLADESCLDRGSHRNQEACGETNLRLIDYCGPCRPPRPAGGEVVITYVDKSGALCVDVAKFMQTESFKRALASTKRLADRLGLQEIEGAEAMSFTDRVDRELEHRRKAKAEIAALRARVEALEALIARWHSAFADVAGDTRDEDQRQTEETLVADTETFLPTLLEKNK